MPDANDKLYLYEALELRAEYDARIKDLKDCLPESRQNRSRFMFPRDDETVTRPTSEFSVADAREQLRTLEVKRRKLNSAIQSANFETRVAVGGDSMSLVEALEVRKALNARLGELHTQVVDAAYERVIYKEGRDIVQKSEVSYRDAVERLDRARVEFRQLNRQLRAATFETVVGFADEPAA